MSNNKRFIQWNNVFVLVFVHVLAFVGYIYLKNGNPPQRWGWWLIGYCVFHGLPITAGYHRLYAHLSYQAHKTLELYYLVIGAGAFEGPVATALDPNCTKAVRGTWAPKHRDHHSYTDTKLDPYNAKPEWRPGFFGRVVAISKAFWHSHVGWIFLKETHSPLSNCSDLRKNPLIAWQEKYYVLLAVISGIVLPTLVGAYLGSAAFGLLVLGAGRIVINWHSTFFVNSLAHMIGRQPYKNGSTAKNSFITALVTLGEGNHADHHQFPRDYRNGLKWYSWDPTGWFIWSMQWVGLTKNLYRTPQHLIDEAIRVD